MSDSNAPGEVELAPDQAPAADLPRHARERLANMRRTRFFTSDLSVNEFMLVRQVGFEPLGLVMGSSIYRIRPSLPSGGIFSGPPNGELADLSQAMYHSRELAMTRMEEEAAALGADGIIGVRLTVNLHAWGNQVAEFVAVGTAVRHRGAESFRTAAGKPFTSDLSGQDFWTLLRSGYRPLGFVMGNCVYYVAPSAVSTWSSIGAFGSWRNQEMLSYTHALYDARELAIERLQAEAEDLGASGIVGVTVTDQQHSWKNAFSTGVGAFRGELIEFFVVGTAVAPLPAAQKLPVPELVIAANDRDGGSR